MRCQLIQTCAAKLRVAGPPSMPLITLSLDDGCALQRMWILFNIHSAHTRKLLFFSLNCFFFLFLNSLALLYCFPTNFFAACLFRILPAAAAIQLFYICHTLFIFIHHKTYSHTHTHKHSSRSAPLSRFENLFLYAQPINTFNN